VEDGGRGADHGMMRAGKAEDAVRTAGLVGIAGRQRRLASRIVEAEFEGRSVLTAIRRQGEATDRDQQALDATAWATTTLKSDRQKRSRMPSNPPIVSPSQTRS
jgi:hypothetical protein